jgi:hypothetical protein
VSPYLTPGVWYVEVRGNGSTEFALTSEDLLLQRPAWNMQQVGQPTTTPGLTAPHFGDSGVNTNGTALPGDQGIDLAQGQFDFYAVNVPTNNSGVMRMVLEAINGNPDLYLRTNNPPTLSHGPNGPFTGTALYERSLTDPTTEYANWVPFDSKFESDLGPGVYYIAVRAAGNSNVRYRLRLSTGNIQPLALNGGASTNIIAAGDYQFFRVDVPTNAPRNWNITFNQILGDVVMYIRDRTPPGQGSRVNDYIDWADDAKNHGPYSNYDPAGTHAVGCPPLRPGHVYYLGFRAVNDATFSVMSATSGVIDHTNVVAFYGGVTNTTIPANGALRFRVDVPADARRWIHYATNVSGVRVYIDQGSGPTVSASDHYACSGVNCTSSQPLYNGTWPWQPGYMYFVTVTNTTASAQPFSFRMDGRNCVTDDGDNDGLPDCWELTFFPSIATSSGAADPDRDGVSNANELLNGTNPTLVDEFRFVNGSSSLSNGVFRFVFVGPINGVYRVEAGPTIIGPWTQLLVFTNVTGSTLISDVNATNFVQRFYRLIVP